jgi:hypothetical protein
MILTKLPSSLHDSAGPIPWTVPVPQFFSGFNLLTPAARARHRPWPRPSTQKQIFRHQPKP